MGMTPAQLEFLASDEVRRVAGLVAGGIDAKFGSLNGLDINDYKQVALIHCAKIIPKYDRRQGPFERFAYRRCYRRVQDAIRQADDVGRSRRADGIRGATASLDAPMFRGDGDDAKVFAASLEVPPRHTEKVEIYDQLDNLLEGLPSTWRAVVYLSMIQGLPAWQIGTVLGIGKPRVKEIRRKALGKIANRNSILAGRMLAFANRKESNNGAEHTGGNGRRTTAASK